MDDTEKQLLEALAMQEQLEKKDYIAVAEGKMNDRIASKEEIIEALKTVSDPEIGINIYDMGLVYDIIQDPTNGDVLVNMTVTSPMCPVAGVLPQQAADAISQVEGTNVIEVRIVWEPEWTPECLSEDAKLMMGM
ncbi:MAG: iron-sulfur cluster assembly protein [Lactobacillus sp.]|jgi:metal-sulfur cluster biosynthetic enzyme|nr:iron-sulfur cluster assembly protein [Lactobacillus sp.]